MNYWAITCPDKMHNTGLWQKWRANSCVAIGWNPADSQWESPPADRRHGFVKAREQILKMQRGDIVVPYLDDWRLGIPGRIERFAVADADWNPLGYNTDKPGEPGNGRRIYVRWLEGGAPPPDQVTLVPEELQEGRPHGVVGMGTIRKLDGVNEYEKWLGVIRNRSNWRPYAPVRGSKRNGLEAAIFPEELPPSDDYYDGAITKVLVNRYERDPRARLDCARRNGFQCKVCDLKFEDRYGSDIGKGFIHVHHIRQLATLKRQHKVNPGTDLVPVCPNCHAMLHRTTPPLTVEALRARLRPRPNETRGA